MVRGRPLARWWVAGRFVSVHLASAVVAAAFRLPGAMHYGFGLWCPSLAAECVAIGLSGPPLPGVYFAVKDGVVLYVGESGNVRRRCADHLTRWPGAQFFALEFAAPVAIRKDLETAFICALLPAGNTRRNTPTERAWNVALYLLAGVPLPDEAGW